ncbi:MAG TPA: M67 family metallopeptidase [Candidatus Nitrosotalea sp.]|nr:M67 family metallopeptidase [Candidatus Nitrosotalea sp.]
MRISPVAMDQIRAHAESGYPFEICGIMIAAQEQGVVTTTEPVRNTVVDRARDRYEMDPVDQIRVQRRCDAERTSIIGYYHSHPDHPAWASLTDAERAWKGPVYLIVSCAQGRVVDANAFIAVADGGPMEQTELIVE